jgi:hypothetical protein
MRKDGAYDPFLGVIQRVPAYFRKRRHGWRSRGIQLGAIEIDKSMWKGWVFTVLQGTANYDLLDLFGFSRYPICPQYPSGLRIYDGNLVWSAPSWRYDAQQRMSSKPLYAVLASRREFPFSQILSSEWCAQWYGHYSIPAAEYQW